ncbi:hypothetical protein MtrunA17_Chr4g0051061 [Medicago truncatula]|uniref:Uncharacterized protein n=1 Tax=Medicago truncatula TaxID=3880 RepID=A0A396IG83_MEDTR|nr:hypothetical protein MtrunA17_Chr4g0051061 [Medicago truncatula]
MKPIKNSSALMSPLSVLFPTSTFEVKKSGIEKTKIMGEDRKSEKKGEMGNPETLAKDQSKVGVALVNATS